MLWTPDLSVGVELIDEQHKALFEKAEQLFEAGKNNRAKEYVGELLRFLDEYTRKHFGDEERYMLSINYPGYNEQKAAHMAFIAKLDDLRKEYDKSGGNLMVILNANRMVLDWLIQHISKMDKEIGEFAKKQHR